uniref:Uncharacterized protein n=1 Tax=Arundo donax TaxID=35708 RepID=A0A0A9GHG5_ARUDO
MFCSFCPSIHPHVA